MKKEANVGKIAQGLSAFGFAGKAFALLIGMALLTILSIYTYQSVLHGGELADQRRATIGYLRTQIASLDSGDSIHLEGEELILTEHTDSGNYQLHLYVKEGMLCEEYAPANTRGSVKKLVPCTAFQAEMVGDGLLHLRVDGEECYIKLFSSGEVAE